MLKIYIVHFDLSIPFLPDPDFYLHRERIRQLYTELYKERHITKFRNTKISIERKVGVDGEYSGGLINFKFH